MFLRVRALLAEAVLAFLVACGPAGRAEDGSAGTSALTDEPRAVKSAPVRREPWELTATATGELAAFEEVVLAAKVPGRLAELALDIGQPVKKGDIVATLEDREYELRVAQAEAAVAAARALLGIGRLADGDEVATEDTAIFRIASAELEETRLQRDRAAELAREGVDSQAVLDTLEAELRGAESRLQEARELVENRRAFLAQRRAELEIARAQLDETRIEAPFDGVVRRRLAATGGYLASGDPIAALVRIDPLRVRLEIPEREASAVAAGQTVRVDLGMPGKPREGKVVRLSPSLDPENRTLTVEAELPNPDGSLRPGSFVEALIVVDPAALAVTIPAEAIVTFAGIDRVFVVREGSAEERRVSIGRREDVRAEILEGVEEGEVVILSPGKLASGTPVRVGN